MKKNGRTYSAVFLTAFSVLTLEITLTRVLSACLLYYLVFFAISCALLGLTAGALTVYLKTNSFDSLSWRKNASRSLLLFTITAPLSLFLLAKMKFFMELHFLSPQIWKLLALTLACSLPFYFAGITLNAVLTRSSLPVNRVYAADLLGASAGCLFVLKALEIFSGPNLIFLTALLGLPAAGYLSRESESKDSRFGFLAGLTFLLLVTAYMTVPKLPYLKLRAEEKSWNFIIDRWNSFSRVIVRSGLDMNARYWGASPRAPKALPFQHIMLIDGMAGTTMVRSRSEKDLDFLHYDVTNAGYFLRPGKNALIIGIGGGRDLQSALLFGKEQVTGVEINPIFTDLLQKDLRGVTGLADNPRVKLITDEARNYLSRSGEKFSTIQMSLTDTWASSSAGAFSLSENTLYTADTWKLILEHLTSDGIFMAARFSNSERNRESTRLVSLAAAALLRSGISNIQEHLAVLSAGNIDLLLMAKEPLTPQDRGLLLKIAKDYEYIPVLFPGKVPDDPFLKKILSARSEKELNNVGEGTPFDLSPSTDDRPYFFNMLRLDHLLLPVRQPGALLGNVTAAWTLLQLLVILTVLSAAVLALPLLLSGKKIPSFSGGFYFSLTGAGFMLAEIALVQRLSVFLGHPVYALGIILFTLILGAGLGSLMSGNWPLTEKPWKWLLPAAAGSLILAAGFLSAEIAVQMRSAAQFLKILSSAAMLLPLGIVLGMFFPAGLRIAASSPDSMPWYCALNGIFGVFCSAAAVFISVYFGISRNFYLAALCYFLILPVLNKFSEQEKIF